VIKTPIAIALAIALQAVLSGPASAAVGPDECGLASVYAMVSGKTASGDYLRAAEFTAAHRSLAFGTMVRVRNRHTGIAAVVRITDRGPFRRGRIIDLSRIAARHLGISGLTKVCLSVVPGE
jgi:rare lipoprotein A